MNNLYPKRKTDTNKKKSTINSIKSKKWLQSSFYVKLKTTKYIQSRNHIARYCSCQHKWDVLFILLQHATDNIKTFYTKPGSVVELKSITRWGKSNMMHEHICVRRCEEANEEESFGQKQSLNVRKKGGKKHLDLFLMISGWGQKTQRGQLKWKQVCCSDVRTQSNRRHTHPCADT